MIQSLTINNYGLRKRKRVEARPLSPIPEEETSKKTHKMNIEPERNEYFEFAGSISMLNGNEVKAVYRGQIINNDIETPIFHGDGLILTQNYNYIFRWGKGIQTKIGVLIDSTDNRKIYYGEMEKYLPNGLGLSLIKPNVFYYGNYTAGKRNPIGYNCIIDIKERTEYWGQLKSFQKHGFGKLTHKDKTFFHGYWANDKPHGFGILVNSNNSGTFGIWENGVKTDSTYDFSSDELVYDYARLKQPSMETLEFFSQMGVENDNKDFLLEDNELTLSWFDINWFNLSFAIPSITELIHVKEDFDNQNQNLLKRIREIKPKFKNMRNFCIEIEKKTECFKI